MTQRKKIGLLVPSTNTVAEPDYWRMAPKDVSVHTARMLLKGASVAALSGMNNQIEEGAKYLATAGVDIVAYACTSGSFFGGPGYDKEVSKRIQGAAGVPAVATSTAVVEALHALNIKRVCVATPYPDELTQRIPPFLTAHGVEVVSIAGQGLGKKAVTEIGAQEPEDVYKFALAHWDPKAEGLFLSCTDWRSLEVIERLEKAIGKPVVGANHATIWLTLRKLDYNEPIEGYGRLYRLPAPAATRSAR